MKRTWLLFTCLCFAQISDGQTIRRVNPNVIPGKNIYRTAQAAHDAADPGDIILFEPYYGSVPEAGITVTKPLTLYGDGYFLGSTDPLWNLNNISLEAGSEGTELMGLEIEYVYLSAVSNIRIERSRIGEISISTQGTNSSDVSDIVIHSNFIETIYSLEQPGYSINNVSIANNKLLEFGNNTVDQNWTVTNNTIYNGSIYLNNGVFENNLCYSVVQVQFTNVAYNYNVSSGNHFAGGNGNQNNVDMSNEFAGTSFDAGDQWFRLKDSSILKTAASDGGEVGAFGGGEPYVISGIPAIPSISDISVKYQSRYSGPLEITFDVKANN